MWANIPIYFSFSTEIKNFNRAINFYRFYSIKFETRIQNNDFSNNFCYNYVTFYQLIKIKSYHLGNYGNEFL